MSNKLLYGKALSTYTSQDEEENLDALLASLTEAELKELGEEIDPDNSLLPASQRCRNQTEKQVTGPFNRDELIRFLIEKAKADPDWDEEVPFEKRIRGKVFTKKPLDTKISGQDLTDMGFDVEFEEGITEALENATEDELVDLAGILGFTGMLNQVQFHASLENRWLESSGGFSDIAKSQKFKIISDEPPNMTNIEESIERLAKDDPSLTVLNLNNIKTMSAEVMARLFTALGDNSHLLELHMASSRILASMLEPLLLPLKANHTLRLLNLESNFITGDMILKVLDAISDEKSGLTDLRLANQRQQTLGVQVEQAITRRVLANRHLFNFGLDLETAEARVRVRDHLKNNLDRETRQARLKGEK